MTSPLLDACSIQKNDYQVAVLALILSPRTVPNVSVYGSGQVNESKFERQKKVSPKIKDYYSLVIKITIMKCVVSKEK